MATPAPKVNKFWNFTEHGNDAELQLFGTISSEEDWWSDDCVTYRNFINDLNALGPKDNINVLIQSQGGDVFAANAIYNALVANSAKITATIIGICASAATIILQAAETRRIAKNGVIMAHNPKVTVYGAYEADDLRKLAEATDKVKDSIKAVYRDRLGKTDDEIEEMMNETAWYVGQEAVDNGFCDEVIEENFTNAAVTNEGRYSFKNYVEPILPDDVRKKVQNLSKTPQKDDGTFFNKTNPQKGNNDMGQNQNQNTAPVKIENAAQLRSAYPDMINQIVDEAIQNERDRLKAIDEIANGIPDDVLKKAKYDEPLSAAELALAQMKANNAAGVQTMTNVVDDLTKSGSGEVGAVPNVGNDAGAQTPEQKEAKVRGFANALKGDKRRKEK